MTNSTTERSLSTTTCGLLTYYSYEGDSQPQTSLLQDWLGHYPPEWVRLALIEALYRGRYKTISVGGLLADWQRRGQPIYHFNREFEALICQNFPKIWSDNDGEAGSKRSSTPSLSSSLMQNSELSAAMPQTASDVDAVNSQSDVSNPTHRASQSDPSIPVESKTAQSDPLQHQGPDFSALYGETPVEMSEHEEPRSDHHAEQSVGEETKFRGFVDPIHQFTPNRESSEHYRKLVAMASHKSQSHGHRAKTLATVAP